MTESNKERRERIVSELKQVEQRMFDYPTNAGLKYVYEDLWRFWYPQSVFSSANHGELCEWATGEKLSCEFYSNLAMKKVRRELETKLFDLNQKRITLVCELRDLDEESKEA